MDGFAGYKTAAADVVPEAVIVMDPFHVVALAGTKLDLIRQRIQQQTLGRRGHTGDPLYGSGASPAPESNCCRSASTTG
jgi:transposase